MNTPVCSQESSDAITILRQALLASVAVGKKFHSACDIGCGTGVLGIAFLDIVGSMHFLDISEESINILKKKIAGGRYYASKISFQSGDIFSLSQTDFDLILFLLSLHHIPDWRKTLSEAVSKLVLGGEILICDLFHEGGKFHREKVFYHGFCPYTLSNFLQNEFPVECDVKFLAYLPKDQKDYPLFLLHIFKKAE